MPDRTNDSVSPGPAYCAPRPTMTNMPAPMIAPTPRAVSWKTPKVRLRLCSPVSRASSINRFSGLVASRFGIRLRSPWLFGRLNCVGTSPPPRPPITNTDSQQYHDQSPPPELRFVAQQYHIHK